MFTLGKFTAHSGEELDWKIECDSLTDEDIETLASIISKCFKFNQAFPIHTGGDKLAKALQKYRDTTRIWDSLLIVDDVLTTGGSMVEKYNELRKLFPKSDIEGIVIFSRGERPSWITPVFQLNKGFK